MNATAEPKAVESSQQIGAVLAEYRQIKDERDKLIARDGELSKREQELKAALLDFHAATGLQQLADHGLTVRFNDSAVRTRYEPERWRDILLWAAQSGNDFIVQRRLTDSKVASLVESGIALPQGLTLETYTDVSVRRK